MLVFAALRLERGGTALGGPFRVPLAPHGASTRRSARAAGAPGRQPPLADERGRRAVLVPHARKGTAPARPVKLARSGSIDQIVIAQHTAGAGGRHCAGCPHRRRSRDPGRRFAGGHARPDRASPAGAAAVRRPDGLRGRRRGHRPAAGVRARRLGAGDHGRGAVDRAAARPAGSSATADAQRPEHALRRRSAPSCRARPTTTRRSCACRCWPTTASSAR